MQRRVMLTAALAATMGLPMAMTLWNHQSVWIAKPKRGNRRNRSRWNYRR